MPEIVITASISNSGTRNEVRMRVVDLLSKEMAGEGRGELASRYKYYVERLSDGRRIFLSRPAFMHNGFDFVVRVEGMNFAREGRRRDAPSHEDMFLDLQEKKEQSLDGYKRLYALLRQVYTCQDVSDDIMRGVQINVGMPAEMILKVFKWLFIEQEIRYWNYSGRDMLWQGVPSI